MWGTGDELCLQTKTMGAGINMSDLYSGFLQLSNQEHSLVFVAELIFPKSSKLFLEYGAEKTGYWTGEKSMQNVGNAVKMTKFFKYNYNKQPKHMPSSFF